MFPWVILFRDDNPIGGFVAMVMQASLIGWIPAVLWAWKTLHPADPISPQDSTAPKETSKKSNASSTKATK